MKKIIFITFHLDKGGAEKIFTDLVLNLQHVFKIHVVVVKGGGVYEKQLKESNIISYTTLNSAGSSFIQRTLLLRKQIKKINPHKIVSFLYYPNIITWLASINMNIPIVLSERSNPRIYLKESLKNRILGILLKRAYRKADVIIPVSNKVGQFICEDFKVSHEKIIPIQNTIDIKKLDKLADEGIDDFDFKQDKKYLISVGRLEKAKNYSYLLEAFSIALKKHSTLELIILGEGEEYTRLKKLTVDLNIAEQVHFTGFKQNPHKYVRRADTFVLSSSREGFPNALLEAMYVNGHVVSTNCDTGPDEIITDGLDGLLAPLDDSAKFSSLIERMTNDKELREKVFYNSRKKIQQFTLKNMIKKYKETINH